MTLDDRLRDAGALLDEAAAGPDRFGEQLAARPSRRTVLVAAALLVVALAAFTLSLVEQDDGGSVVAGPTVSDEAEPGQGLERSIATVVSEQVPGYGFAGLSESPGGPYPLTDVRFVFAGGAELRITIYATGGFDTEQMAELVPRATASEDVDAWQGANDLDLRSIYMLDRLSRVGVRLESTSSEQRLLLSVDELVEIGERLVGLPDVAAKARQLGSAHPVGATFGELPPVAGTDGPSQRAPAAERDRVHPEVAELSHTDRSERLVSVEVPDGFWVLSRPRSFSTAQLGDPDGRYGIERVVLEEYGEILFLGRDGGIQRAYPMPGLVPSWLHVSPTHVYAGRVGDGALPASSIVRINRSDFSVEVIVFAVDGHEAIDALDWQRAGDAVQINRFVTVGLSGRDVASWIGPVAIDVEAIDRLVVDQ